MPEITPAASEDDYQPTLVELLAESIPTELTATAHVGIGSARRLKIAWAVLPVVEAAIEQARREAAEKALNDAAEIAHLTGTDNASGARSPTARATWRMVAKWLRARADLARTEPTKETGR